MAKFLNITTKKTLDLNDVISGCKINDRQSQRAFVDHFAKYLFGVCKRYVWDEEEAKDVVQDSFVAIFNNINDFRSDAASIKAWARQITINAALQRIRKSYRTKEVLLENNIDNRDEMPDIYGKLGVEEIMNLLSQLPQMYNQVFNMYVIDGFSHKEISDTLGMQESSSRAILTRAKKMMRDKIFELQKMAI